MVIPFGTVECDLISEAVVRKGKSLNAEAGKPKPGERAV